MTRLLNNACLVSLPDTVIRPQYDRQQVSAGIVHLGVGAFHRAHQAWYTEHALNRNGGNWGIVGASLRSDTVANQLNPQNGLYTLVERDGNHRKYQVIGAITNVLVAPENPEALLARMADPDIRLVTLTITEKGYFYSASEGTLRLDDPAIVQDLKHFPRQPATAIGYLAASLRRRRDAGAGGVTLLSCDNLPHNGRVLARVLKDFVQRVDPALLSWIEAHVRFPCSMVDRIVPASTDSDLAELESLMGCQDRGAVFTEPFCQWVIENNFARGAPDWESAGALYVDDVSPFETMKLRLLNGSHSLMAYLGFLAGYDYVHQVMADGVFANLIRKFMDDQVQPTLEIPAGFDVEEYKNQLCKRFANSALNHRLFQIAQDGSQKIPQRWVTSLRELLIENRPVDIMALALAGWIRFLQETRDNGEHYVIDDPMHERLRRVAGGGDPVELIREESIFGNLFDESPEFVSKISRVVEQLKTRGVLTTLNNNL